jgi:hypothetical protein
MHVYLLVMDVDEILRPIIKSIKHKKAIQ